MQPSDYLKEINPEVFYHQGNYRVLNTQDILFLKNRSKANPRKRARICLHDTPDDLIHEMLIVHHRDAYVRPHAHKVQGESLQVIEGQAEAIFFDENGKLQKIILMSNCFTDDGCPYYYRIPKGQIHALRIMSDWFVFQEVAAGPFDPDASFFPSWSPDGKDNEIALKWLRDLTI